MPEINRNSKVFFKNFNRHVKLIAIERTQKSIFLSAKVEENNEMAK